MEEEDINNRMKKDNIDDDSSLYDWLNDEDEQDHWAVIFSDVVEQALEVGSDVKCSNDKAMMEGTLMVSKVASRRNVIYQLKDFMKTG